MRPDLDSRLAHAMGRRDEEPNVQLAEELAQARDTASVARIAEILASGSKAARNDAIKVLYEVGARDPDLLRPHTRLFLEQMRSRNNRMVWGALTALAELGKVDAEAIAPHLASILAAADAGSVIAKDQAMNLLIALMSAPEVAQVAADALFERLGTAAVNQLPMYAERALPAMNSKHFSRFRDVLLRRLNDDMPQSKRRRIETVIRKLG